MLFIPIRTETSVRHAPIANVALVGLNIVVFLIFDFAPTGPLQAIKEHYFVLNGQHPAFYQLITYQFAHAEVWHLVGNMLFLWVFGNGVNAKLGDIPYLLFYLAGGMFAGLAFHWVSDASLLGASGSISAVTAAYLVLFPRSRVTVLYIFFFIGVIHVPAMLIILLKIVLWDNIISPLIASTGSPVAHSAHLAGYLFGFLGAMILLLTRAVKRDQYDLLALFKRWNQRRAFAAAMASPEAQARAQYGSVARVPVGRARKAEMDSQIDRRTELRAKIAEHLARRESAEALAAYEQLMAQAPEQILPAAQQIEIGREYYKASRSAQAAAAFERYIAQYHTMPDVDETRLLLGIIYARDLGQYESAEKSLASALEGLSDPRRREQAERWLLEARSHIQRPAGDTGKTPG